MDILENNPFYLTGSFLEAIAEKYLSNQLADLFPTLINRSLQYFSNLSAASKPDPSLSLKKEQLQTIYEKIFKYHLAHAKTMQEKRTVLENDIELIIMQGMKF